MSVLPSACHRLQTASQTRGRCWRVQPMLMADLVTLIHSRVSPVHPASTSDHPTKSSENGTKEKLIHLTTKTGSSCVSTTRNHKVAVFCPKPQYSWQIWMQLYVLSRPVGFFVTSSASLVQNLLWPTEQVGQGRGVNLHWSPDSIGLRLDYNYHVSDSIRFEISMHRDASKTFFY